MYMVNKVLNPEIYQGKYKRRHYFEGWYFKLIDKNQENVLSIIPGISKGNETKDDHAFIQIFNGNTGSTNYIRFPIDEFSYNKKTFFISIQNNHFSRENLYLNLKQNDISIKGNINFYNIVPYPKTLKSPGIMGYYSYIPFMECNHGIVNIHHEIQGKIYINEQPLDLTGGFGYVEKDWGTSFPQSWIWIQCNHFSHSNISFMFSIAKIPWFNSTFTGFIAFLKLENDFYNFATYNKSTITRLTYDEKILSVTLDNNKYTLEVQVQLSQIKGELKAPKLGKMNRNIKESMSSTLSLKLQKNDGTEIYGGNGSNTCTEFAGDVDQFTVNTVN